MYKNHFAPIKKLNVFSRNHNKTFICRRWLNSHTSENMLMIHKLKCEKCDITTIRFSSDSNLHWRKNNFHRNPLYFGIDAVFVPDNEIGKSIRNEILI